MNKEIYKTFKKAVEEIKYNDEIKANLLYRDIWQDIIGQFVVAGSIHNTFLCFLDMYIKRINASENTKRILISRLTKDGFKLGLRKECPNAYAITKKNVITYINKISNKTENIEKIIITPAIETKSR